MRLCLGLAALLLACAADEVRATSCAPYPLTVYLRCDASACVHVWATFAKRGFGLCSRYDDAYALSPEVAGSIADEVGKSGQAQSGLYRASIGIWRFPRPPTTKAALFQPGQPFHRRRSARGPVPASFPGAVQRIADLNDARALAQIQESVAREARQRRLLKLLQSALYWSTFGLMGLVLARGIHRFYRTLYASDLPRRALLAPIGTQMAVAILAFIPTVTFQREFGAHVIWLPVAVFALLTEAGSTFAVTVSGLLRRDRRTDTVRLS